MMNGMDRVMHLSFVTTAPRHEGGQGIAKISHGNELFLYFCIAPDVGEKQGICGI